VQQQNLVFRGALATALLAGLAALPVAARQPAFPALFDSQGFVGAADAQALGKKRFEEFDANHDGVITEAEFEEHSMQMFKQIDSDGRVTRSEARAFAVKQMPMLPALLNP
jgi:hypothetical protein